MKEELYIEVNKVVEGNFNQVISKDLEPESASEIVETYSIEGAIEFLERELRSFLYGGLDDKSLGWIEIAYTQVAQLRKRIRELEAQVKQLEEQKS